MALARWRWLRRGSRRWRWLGGVASASYRRLVSGRDLRLPWTVGAVRLRGVGLGLYGGHQVCEGARCSHAHRVELALLP